MIEIHWHQTRYYLTNISEDPTGWIWPKAVWQLMPRREGKWKRVRAFVFGIEWTWYEPRKGFRFP